MAKLEGAVKEQASITSLGGLKLDSYLFLTNQKVEETLEEVTKDV